MDAPLFKEIKEKTMEHVKILEELVALKVLAKKPSFPKLVVVGDPDSNKTEFVSKLVGVPLPDEDLDVPIILKFKRHNESSRKFSLTYYSSPAVQVTEDNLVAEMARLTGENVAAPDNRLKCSSFEVTILQQQEAVFDLTVVVLPGIRDHSNESEVKFITGYALMHTSGEACLFLHVISAPTSESCRSMEPYHRNFCVPSDTRIVTILTNVESCSESRVIDLTSNIIDIPFGYVFIKSGEEQVESKSEEAADILTKIDQKFLGYQIAAKHVVTGLMSIMFSPYSMVTGKLKDDLKKTETERKRFEKEFESLKDALPTMVSVVGFASSSLEKLFISKQYKEYSGKTSMRPAHTLQGHFDRFYATLVHPSIHTKGLFLKEEYMLLQGLDWECPADLQPPTELVKPLLNKLLSEATVITESFVTDVFQFIDDVVVNVILNHAKEYPKLHATIKMAARRVIFETKDNFRENVKDLLEREGRVFHTCQPSFKNKWKTLKLVQFKLSDVVNGVIDIQGLGRLEVDGDFSQYDEMKLNMAFKLKMLMASYWECAVNRFADNLFVHLMLSIRELLPHGIRGAMVDYLQRIVEDGSTNLVDPEPSKVESTSNLENRAAALDKLKKGIQKLQEHLVV